LHLSLTSVCPRPTMFGIMAAPNPVIGGLLGHYRLEEQIGHGGMGIVFRAHDERLRRDVAIKILHPGTLSDESARKRFRAEALTLSKLNHPNIASVYDFDTQDGVDFLVMELVAGRTLHESIHGRPLNEAEVIDIGSQIAAALQDAHEHGIVHGDLKPSNIALTPKRQVKILDFGLARRWRAGDAESTDSMSRLGAGTLPYMAPEQFSGTVDVRSDIWAAGAVLYEMATGRRCFPEPTLATAMEAILRRDPLPPAAVNPGISPEVDRVIMKALAKDPARRFHSADALAAALDTLRGSSVTWRSRVRALTPAVRHRAAKTAAIAAAALIVLALVMAVPTLRRRLSDNSPGAGLPARKIVAVLPFRNVGSDTETSAFGDGLTETLSSRLAQLSETHSIQVIPTQEIRAAGAVTADKARSNFGVTLVVEGSLQKMGSIMRINCHLIDAATQRLLRAETITAASSDIFGLEDQTVEQVLRLMAIELGPQEHQALQKHGTANAAAYEYYLRARGYMQDYHKPENIDAAMVAYKRAIDLDPNYALAYAGLGEAYWREFGQTHDRALVDNATRTCQKALAISEKLSEAHFCLGRVYQTTGTPEKAVEQFELAVVLDPNSDDGYRGLAEAYSTLGKPGNAEATYQRAISLRPQYWASYSWLGAFYFRQARYSDAEYMFKKVAELSPDNFRGHSNLGAVYVLQGRYADALETLNKSIAERPTVLAYSNLGNAYFGLRRFDDAARTFEQGLTFDAKNWRLWGNLGDARYWIPQQRARAPEAYRKAIALAGEQLQVNPRNDVILGLVASYEAMLGEKQAAMAHLNRALAIAPKDPDLQYRAALVHNHFGETELTLKWLSSALATGFSPVTVRNAPDFDSLRDNPKFQRLMQPH
jgi:tetratricopeptide (TPR) repeat protein/predicted Ser/Thr protein kinase